MTSLTPFDNLPTIDQRRIAVRVTNDAIRQIRGGHPWVYDDSITSASRDGNAGDLAVVFDQDRNFVAIGLWDPTSPIRLKVLHRGKPQTIDSSFWRAAAQHALDQRGPLLADGSTTGYRWINGENDGFAGLVADRYHDTVVLKLYSSMWFPHLADVVEALVAVGTPASVIVRFARNVAAGETFGIGEGDAVFGVVPHEPVRFRENSLRFEADVVAGQKTGHFLDQRDNRQRLRGYIERSGGVDDVLDMFASTGGFSVYAAAAGARHVVSVDASEPTLAAATRNVAHNASLAAVASCRHQVIVGDAFDVMRQMHRDNTQFDVVIVDPPSFAQRQTSVDRGVRAYTDLAQCAAFLVRRGGLLVQASCSSRIPADRFVAAVRAGVQLASRDLIIVEQTGHGVDHPVSFSEGAYLKAVFARLE